VLRVLRPDQNATAEELRDFLSTKWRNGGCPRGGPSSRPYPRRAWASSTRKCCARSTAPTSFLRDARLVTSFDALADEVAAVESRVADAIFDSVRAQMRDDDAEVAKELERRLSKVRRSLQKAEHLLRVRARTRSSR